jgi:amidophosphoribosyltransferase
MEYYIEKYGSWRYGLNKLYLLMEKQHNRGQQGAGIGCVDANAKPGHEYIFRERAGGNNAIKELFQTVHKESGHFSDTSTENHIPYCGSVYMGHLRYSPSGKSGMSYLQPILRRNNWRSRSLMLCGNFSMTNPDEIFDFLLSQGQHPRLNADSLMILEMMGNHLDREVQALYDNYKRPNLFDEKSLSNQGDEMNRAIAPRIDLGKIIRQTAEHFDGGYVLCGVTGNTDMFALRDPNGIRSAFYYHDDEIAIIASERPVIQTAMNLQADEVKELQPGEAFIVRQNGEIVLEQIQEARTPLAPCSFERIYFSRGSDIDIYKERKMLGELLVNPILKSVDNDIINTVFSFIPNTSEVAFFGMMEGFEKYLNERKKILLNDKNLSQEEVENILMMRVRQEKVAIKDIKLRTFIAEGSGRDDLAAHVYDITYGSIVPTQDNLVVIDDSIVRGTTLKQSIIRILSRLQPKKIVVVSSAPQVRYPDFYGIDMSSMSDFVAFRAAVELLKERGMQSVIDEVYQNCIAQKNLPKEKVQNAVKAIYEPFTDDEISIKIAELLTPEDTQCPVELVYQSIEGLHKACPNHKGDWYFSGNYPTAGGNKLVNQAFMEYYENK